MGRGAAPRARSAPAGGACPAHGGAGTLLALGPQGPRATARGGRIRATACPGLEPALLRRRDGRGRFVASAAVGARRGCPARGGRGGTAPAVDDRSRSWQGARALVGTARRRIARRGVARERSAAREQVTVRRFP